MASWNEIVEINFSTSNKGVLRNKNVSENFGVALMLDNNQNGVIQCNMDQRRHTSGRGLEFV